MRLLIVTAAVMLWAGAASAQQQQYSAEQLVRAWDKDQDGILSKAEWLAAGRREQGFDFADRDKDGKLTVVELRAAMARAQQRQGG